MGARERVPVGQVDVLVTIEERDEMRRDETNDMNDVMNTSDARCFSRSDSRARERGVKMTASATRFSFTA